MTDVYSLDQQHLFRHPLKQVPISQGLSTAFFSAGWLGTGPGKCRKIRLRAPRPPPWAGGEIAANLECLLYYIAVFLLSTHIAGPSCARLMWPGGAGLFHPSQPPTRRKGAASCTTTICGSVFPWWSRRRSRQNRRASREHAVAVAYSAGRVSSCTSGRALHFAIAAAGPLGQRGCAESRRPRLRLSGVEVVLVSQRRAGRDGFARLGGLCPESFLDALRYLDAPLVRRRDAVLGERHVPTADFPLVLLRRRVRRGPRDTSRWRHLRPHRRGASADIAVGRSISRLEFGVGRLFRSTEHVPSVRRFERS